MPMAFVSKRYLLFQIPGWILAAMLLGALHRWLDLPLEFAIGLFVLYVAKDFVIYPYVRKAYEPHNKTGAELLIGCVGLTKQRLDPEGYVQVKGELWRAVADPPGEPIPPGQPVRIQAVSGLTLVVTWMQDQREGT
jgi:membrane protein implicated in regulation of membrane protease activity